MTGVAGWWRCNRMRTTMLDRPVGPRCEAVGWIHYFIPPRPLEGMALKWVVLDSPVPVGQVEGFLDGIRLPLNRTP